MGRRRLAALALVSTVAGVVVMVGAPPAFAGCHAFTVKAAPETANEGQTVTVTVTRDAAVNPSNVDVSSVDGTAKGGQDFPAVQRTISFTTETSQSFPIVMTDDPDAESAESFQLHLSKPGGCAVNPNFSLGPDATVTIAANDASNTTTAPPTTRANATPTTSRASSTTVASTTSSAVEQTTSSSAAASDASSTTLAKEAVAVDQEDDDDSSSTGAVIAILVVLAVIAAAGGYFFLRRRAGRP